MKTTHSLYKFVLAFILTMTAALQLQAQEAFYIYRNDGDFDGFFFDQVEKMNLSKFDLDSVEHNEYVVQDIVTADSTYRIPLAAIDSIGFQQPEIILNPNLIYLDESGLIPYFTYFEAGYDFGTKSDKVFFRLAYDTPQNILPKEGDVIANFTNPNYSTNGPDNFGGLVFKIKSISRYDDTSQWYVYGEPITEISDIIIQLISIEEISEDATGQVRRRMAGINADGSPRKAAGSARVSLIDFSGTLHRDFSPREDITIGLEAGLGLKVGLRMAYNISTERILVKTAVETKVSVAPALSAKASGSFEIPVDGLPKFLKSIKFPAIAPLFQTRPFPDIFVRGGGELALKATLPTVALGWKQVYTIDTDRYPFMASYSMILDGPENMSLSDFMDVSSTDLSLSLSGFVQTGIKLSANIETNDWVEKVFSSSIGLNLYCGPKLEGNLTLSLAGLKQDGAYGMLKNSGIKAHALSADLEAKAQVSFLWHDPEETTFFDASRQWGTMEFYLFPSFAPTDANYDPKTGDVVATVHPDRMTLLPCHVGMTLLDYKGDFVDKAVNPKTHYLQGFGYDFTNNFGGLACGRYTVRPFIEIAGVEIPVNDSSLEREVIVTPMLDLRVDSVGVEANGGSQEQAYITNMPKENIMVLHSPQWVNITIEETDLSSRLGGMKMEVEPNHTLFAREDYIVLTAQTGTYSTSDTLIVHQEADGTFIYAKVTVSYTDQEDGRRQRKYNYSAIGDVIFDSPVETDDPMPSGSFSNSFVIPLTCSREGDIITCSGTLEWSLDSTLYDNKNYTENSSARWAEQGKHNLTESYHCMFVIDMNPKSPRIISGAYQHHLNHKFERLYNAWSKDWVTPGHFEELLKNHQDETEYEFISDEASWNYDIPYDIPTSSYSLSVFEELDPVLSSSINYKNHSIFPEGMIFALKGNQVATFSHSRQYDWQEVSTSYGYKQYSAELEKTTERTKFNHLKEEVGSSHLGKGGSIEILLTY